MWQVEDKVAVDTHYFLSKLIAETFVDERMKVHKKKGRVVYNKLDQTIIIERNI